MKALVKVGYRCNQRCLFCHAEGRRGVEAGGSEVEALLVRAARLGHSAVVLSGGEPTLRPELPAWARRIAALGMDLGLVTNGALLDAGAVRTLVRARLRYVQLSLHGGTAEVHDAIAGVPGFRRALGALRALAGQPVEVWVNCVVVRPNLERLREVVDAVAPFEGVALKFSAVDPRGAAAGGAVAEALVPRIADAAERVRDALGYAAGVLGPRRPLAHDGFPLCLLAGLEDLRGDLRAHGFRSMAEADEPDLFPVDERNATKPPRCAPCALRGRCQGLFAGYLARHGEGELLPVAGGSRPSSFDYLLEARVPAPSDGRCPVEALGVSPWDRARDLFVRHGERVARFRVDTRELCDEQLLDVKERTGQVYLALSPAAASGGAFPPLAKLRHAGECRRCALAPRCTGLFEPARDDVLRRDEARVLALVSGLEGEVLAVGCGERRHLDVVAAAAEAGRLRLTALDPDPARAAALRRGRPWARAVVGRAEDLPVRGGPFDHVLLLRSWNLLADPDRALARLAGALRPGGTLTVVDGEAFGIARARARPVRAGTPTAAPGRPRNDGAADVHAAVERALRGALRLVERRDVGPDTGNEWLLRYSA